MWLALLNFPGTPDFTVLICTNGREKCQELHFMLDQWMFNEWMKYVSIKREVFSCVVDGNLNYKQVQAAVIQIADRAIVDLFITFDCRSLPIVLLNLRARTWRLELAVRDTADICSNNSSSNEMPAKGILLLSRTIERKHVRTLYSSPQRNFAIYEGLPQQVVRLGWR